MTAPSRRDVARAARVSETTASFALNNHPRVAERTRTRVHEAALRLGYVPNFAARRLIRARFDRRRREFDQVGCIHFFRSGQENQHIDLSCMMMMQGVEFELSKLHVSLFFIRVNERQDWAKVERMTRAGSVDGWLLTGAVDDAVLTRFRGQDLKNTPHVIMGDHRCRQPVHAVNVDFEGVGRLAVEHLASLGHRRIAILKGGTDLVYQRRIAQGFHAERRRLGLEDDRRLAAHAAIWRDDRNGGLRLVDPAIEWLKRNDLMPTAVFIPEPSAAAAVELDFKRWHVEVPHQSNLLACEFTSSPATGENFTRIEWPMAEIGHQGARLLHRLATERNVPPAEITIPPTLVQGWSTGRCKMENAK